MKKKIISILTSLLLVFGSFAEEFNFFGSGDVFKLNPVTDGILIGAGLTFDIADIELDKTFMYGHVVYDGRKYDPLTVNDFDRAMMKPYWKTGDKIGDVLCAVTMLTPCVMFATNKEEWLTVGAMYAESLMFAFGIKEILKMSVGRTRPYMYFDGAPEKDINDGDWNFSFPSGHTTFAFTAAAFSTYVFCSYFPASPWRYAVGFGTFALASSTAFIRGYSGCHFATDLIAGAGIGVFCGLFVPLLHKIGVNNEKGEIPLTESSGVSISPVSLQFSFRL